MCALQEKQELVAELKTKIDSMQDMTTWQEEVVHLDRCIAWCDALELRSEVEAETAAVEEQLPKELDKVRMPEHSLACLT